MMMLLLYMLAVCPMVQWPWSVDDDDDDDMMIMLMLWVAKRN